MRTVIKNGLIYDGSGKAGNKKNIVIDDAKIAAVTQGDGIGADRIIDASGCIVAPGFIDTHRHCDIAALSGEDFGTIELLQGLTSVFGGNCGISYVPAMPQFRREIYDFLEPCLGGAEIEEPPDSFYAYMNALEKRRNTINLGSFIGTGTIKAAIKGYHKGVFSSDEMKAAKDLIIESLEAGAAGISMGIMYQPECYSSPDEIVNLLSAATPYQRVLTCHIRGEGDNLVSSVKEVIQIAKKVELPLNISHFKATGIRNWRVKIHQAIECIHEVRNQGQDVTVDFYPYCGGSTTLISLIPPNIMENDISSTLVKLATKNGQDVFTRNIYQEHPGWDNMVTAIGWERILLSSVNLDKNKKYLGKSFLDASIACGYQEPAHFLCDLLVEERGKVGIIVLSMCQDDVDVVAKLPYAMVISDALYGLSDSPHPRLYNSFPKLIKEYVLERSVLTMEAAIQKMTGLPAKRLGINNRGMIVPGNYADITIFNPEQLKAHATFEKPKELCTGFKAVLVNGTAVVTNDIITKQNCGTVLKF